MLTVNMIRKIDTSVTT